MSRYHSRTLSLLQTPLAWSAANARALAEREMSLGVRLPAAVREWYALEGAVDILRKHSNDDVPVALGELGEPFKDWYGAGRRSFLSTRLVVFMHENQGVSNWAFRLDGSDDPPVVVEVDSAPREEWQPLARTFSEFVYCQVWDHSLKGAGCGAQEPHLDETTLRHLRASFHEEPQTHGWPGSTNHRFSSPAGRILIWHTRSRSADWFIRAASQPRLEELLRAVWPLGTLPKTLYGLDGAGDQAFARLRSD